MVYGGLAVRDGQLSVGSLLVLLAYFAALYSPLETSRTSQKDLHPQRPARAECLKCSTKKAGRFADAPDARPLVM